jgi:predicted nucleotidyltransferase
VSEPRERVAELTRLLQDELGPSLLGLYLFGSLARGDFVEGRSDLDLFAVVAEDVDESRLEALRRLHAGFVARHPEWVERVEIACVAREVLATLASEPAGTLAVVSPGEPLHVTEADLGWVLNWHSVCVDGEVLHGRPPLELGPAVAPEVWRQAVAARLAALRDGVRALTVAYVPAHRGYVVVTVCRALYALATGEQTSKEEAAAWAAGRYPEWGALIRQALADHRADVRAPHEAAMRFVDFAADSAAR